MGYTFENEGQFKKWVADRFAWQWMGSYHWMWIEDKNQIGYPDAYVGFKLEEKHIWLEFKFGRSAKIRPAQLSKIVTLNHVIKNTIVVWGMSGDWVYLSRPDFKIEDYFSRGNYDKVLYDFVVEEILIRSIGLPFVDAAKRRRLLVSGDAGVD